jgi:NTP pyrophosphatase (non-canonical NTP hydrolase)
LTSVKLFLYYLREIMQTTRSLIMNEKRTYEYGKYTLDDWQKHFHTIYGKRNRAQTSTTTWFRMLEEIGEVLEAARPPNLDAVKDTLPDLLAWLSALADVMDISLMDAVSNRYIYGCPHCGASENCSCIYHPDKSQVKPRDIGNKMPLFQQPPVGNPETSGKTLDEWVIALDKLYGETNCIHPLTDITSRLVENAGKVAKILRGRITRDRLEPKVADIFAWIVATYIKYKSIVGASASDLSRLIMDKYHHCRSCKQIPCICKPLVNSIFVGIIAKEAFGAVEEIERIATRIAPILFIVPEGDKTLPNYPDELTEVTILREAKRTDATAIIVTQTITPALQTLMYESLVQGQPVQVFSRTMSERDPQLTSFLERARKAGILTEFRNNAGLRKEFQDWTQSITVGS